MTDGRRFSFGVSCAVLTVIVLLVMGRVCAHDFVEWDDPVTIANNSAFNRLDFAQMLRYWWTPAESLYVPVTYSVWGTLAYVAHVNQADAMGSMLNPWVYHTANLLIHLVASLVVLALLRRLTRNEFAALIGAAIFAVHPLQVEAVAWASGTKDLLCGLFIATSMHAIARYREGARTNWLVFSWFAVLLACLSKPTGIVAPFMCIAIDMMILGASFRRSLSSLWPAFLIASTFAVIGRLVQPPILADDIPIWTRPLVAADALAFYLAKLVWPVPLAIDYGRAPLAAWRAGWLFWTWPAPVAFGCIVYRLRRQIPMLSAGALVALIGVAPVLGLLPFRFQAFSTVADHYLYPSMIGVSMMAAAVIARFDASWVRAASSAMVAALAAVSFVACGHWRDGAQLFDHALAVNPRSFATLTMRAGYNMKRGDSAAALADLNAAVAINPEYALARLQLAQAYLVRGQVRQAATEFAESLRIYSTQQNFDRRLAVAVAGTIATQLEQRGDNDAAAQLLREVLKIAPGDAATMRHLEQLRKSTPATVPAG